MSANSFRSVFMVASCAGAALACYLVSLRVASERAALEAVETEIVLAQRDIRVLQTEIGTRGRLAQLEKWNVKVLALSAPSADQFLGGSFELARMVAPQRKPAIEAPVVLASAPSDGPKPRVLGVEADEPQRASSPSEMLHTASLKTNLSRAADLVPAAPKPKAAASQKEEGAAPTVPAKTSAQKRQAPAKPDAKKEPATAAAAAKKSVDKPAAALSKPVTRPAKLAKADPLAPLPGGTRSKVSKDSDSAR